ncbi:superoxide dismutase family protein [Chitinibacter sp. S2-10]|uniref:superoxide dismutase family protein n=1 Tax=Chitinibacter sp. S2-10 TaxID=3373597 RepID=UPI0039775194
MRKAKMLKSISLAAVLLTACANPMMGSQYGAQFQSAADPQISGKAMLERHNADLRLKIMVAGLKPGARHGFHLHETGDCSASDFSSAGAHFNPNQKDHGHQSTKTHLGDMSNLIADAQGQAMAEFKIDDLSLDPAAANSVIGRAVVIHADADDYKTQPAGNSGARIACGVISEMKQ